MKAAPLYTFKIIKEGLCTLSFCPMSYLSTLGAPSFPPRGLVGAVMTPGHTVTKRTNTPPTVQHHLCVFLFGMNNERASRCIDSLAETPPRTTFQSAAIRRKPCRSHLTSGANKDGTLAVARRISLFSKNYNIKKREEIKKLNRDVNITHVQGKTVSFTTKPQYLRPLWQDVSKRTSPQVFVGRFREEFFSRCQTKSVLCLNICSAW